MTTNLLFTNDAKLLALPQLTLTIAGEKITAIPRLGIGDEALQIDSLVRRQADGAASIQARIPRFVSSGTRHYNAYYNAVLPDFPESLKAMVPHYAGRGDAIRNLEREELARDSRGRVLRQHVWSFPGKDRCYSIQIKDGAVLAKVGPARQTDNGLTYDFDMVIMPGTTWQPWTRPVTRQVEEKVVEAEFSFDLPDDVAPAEPAPAPKRNRKAVL